MVYKNFVTNVELKNQNLAEKTAPRIKNILHFLSKSEQKLAVEEWRKKSPVALP